MRRWRIACLAVFTFLVGGVGTASVGDREELTVGVSLSLKDVMRDILVLFESKHPTLTVRVVYGQSGELRDHINDGAPIDVVVPSNYEDLRALEKKGLTIEGGPVAYASASLVLVAPPWSHLFTTSLNPKRAKEPLRIAVADPQNSVLGRMTQSALAEQTLRPHVRYFYSASGDSVSKAVSEGEADAGVLFRHEAVIHPKLRIFDQAVLTTGVPVRLGASLVWTCRRESLPHAKAFIAFIQTDEAKLVLEKYGYEKLSPSEPVSAR